MIYLKVSLDYLIISIAIAIVLILINTVILPFQRKKKVYELLSKIKQEKGYDLIDFKNKNYDFILENKNKKIYIKVAYVPSNSAITINSRNTWSLMYGANPSKPGKRYPNQRYLKELIPFLKFSPQGENFLKLIIVYKTTDKIQRYLNESEIKILNYKELVYDYQVVTFVELETHFNDLL